jgi:hypothetical protein
VIWCNMSCVMVSYITVSDTSATALAVHDTECGDPRVY